MKYLIVGLGNIGDEYRGTRHNVGFMILDAFAKASNISFTTERYGDVAHMRLKNKQLVLLKPSTYMNLSGDAVGAIANYYKIPAEDIYIICDDLDLLAGKTRIRKKGSAGGHNGIKSLIVGLHTEEFVRFRIGVGHPKDGHTVIEHVLGRPYGEEIERIEAAKKYTADSVERALETTVDKAMNEFNPKRGR